MNNVAISTVFKFLCEHMISSLLGIYLGMEFLGYMVTLCWTFWRTAKPFSKAAVPFCIPTSSWWGFQFLHIPINTCFCLSFYYSHPRGYKVVSPCGFDLLFLMTNDIEHRFMCLLVICVFSLETSLLQFFANFLIGWIIDLDSDIAENIYWALILCQTLWDLG